jgi:predicted lipoprotein with Yx(FWY)xxD motif
MPRLALLALVLALVAGCGDDPGRATSLADAITQPGATATPEAPARERRPGATATPEAPARERRRGKRITVTDSQFGRILADGRGQAVYLFDREQRGRSACYGACAGAWPPVLTKGRPVAGRGARARLLGTTRRRGGERQITYRGRPLYYYVADAPGRVLCHDVFEFGGLWLVIRPDGAPVD